MTILDKAKDVVELDKGGVFGGVSGLWANSTTVELARALLKTEKALTHIIAMAGNPDAAEGCRNIIKVAKEALE